LRSLYRSTPWPAQGPLRATCENRPGPLAAWVQRILSRHSAPHFAPTWGCQCGIYGLARLERAEHLEMSPQVCQRGLFGRSLQVFGVVLLWGRVIQHENGFRAEYARPLKLLTVPALIRGREMRSLLESVAQRYSIELVPGMEELACPA